MVFKPEDEIVQDGLIYHKDWAYVINPGETSSIPVDGLKINGNVYKFTDGLYYITVYDDKFEVHYSNTFYYLYYMAKGGLITSPPDGGWNKLFNSK